MRVTIPDQRPLTPLFPGHEHSQELQHISDILDEIAGEVLEVLHGDLVAGCKNPGRGRAGMTAEQVLRVLVIKQLNGYSYDALTFHLQDSNSYQAFCRFRFGAIPKETTLKQNLKRVSATTLETINRSLVQAGKASGVEKGRKVRVDCTVVETNIHLPADSAQLNDCVRVLTRLMENGSKTFPIRFSRHTKRAKRRFVGIQYAKGQEERHRLYRDLLQTTHATVDDARHFIRRLGKWKITTMEEELLLAGLKRELEHFVDLSEKVINQTTRRVLNGESVPSGEKIFSIFEPHTDIIKKGSRDPEYGHKICLTTGASTMILDCLILDGNPADSELAERMIDRQIEIYSTPPRQAAFDGAFASKENLRGIKEKGVDDVMFNKKKGLGIVEMVKSTWVYKSLRNFRAGVEGCISFLKRCFGFDRCTWKGHESFKSYVWASIVSANLLILGRSRLPTG